ncbi:MAG TPA: 4Fe-4S dicluster domain-containing protein [Candidatus Omnitrophota bacterium]|nr:4Fe-4S dicluster domain-containing protein [Candidatus Omnitrophota bacterium]
MADRDRLITKENLEQLVRSLLAESRVIAPVRSFDGLALEEINGSSIGKIELSGYRTVESFKSWLFKPVEIVSDYFGPEVGSKAPKLVFFGVRGCDAEAIETLDNVYLEGPTREAFYEQNRKQITIITADCTDCGKTCFCNMVGSKPYALKIFDLNLSPVKDGYAVEIGSDRGREIVERNSSLFAETTPEVEREKVVSRQRMVNRLAENNAAFKLKLDLTEILRRNLENKFWKVLTKDCVECSSCNFICPTCSCFVLLDSPAAEGGRRDKAWDACLKAGYTRVAGGANPRGKLFERLQNRYQCKFDYSHARQGRYTCVGCGRCIDGCAGNIDMRKILVELERQVPLTAKLK